VDKIIAIMYHNRHCEQVPNLLDGIHEKLKSISNAQTRTGTMRCVRTLCHQYLAPALTHLLSKTLPWDRQVIPGVTTFRLHYVVTLALPVTPIIIDIAVLLYCSEVICVVVL
jgi:hypothetical protein